MSTIQKSLALVIFAAVAASAQAQAQRIGGVESAAAIQTPEPATNMMIGGALVGFALYFRRKSKS